MASTIKIISSMATRQLLADLISRYQADHPQPTVQAESVGGVDAAKRVQADEAFDVVVLASDAIDKLIAAGKALTPRFDVVSSGVAVAVKAGAPRPDISSEEALKQAVLAAPTLSYSTGPSGVQLAKLFERWGIADEIKPRIVQAPPGVPVGSLVAKGEVALGFQQLSEMMSLPGIDVIGPLPPAVQITTIFSAALATTCTDRAAAQPLLDFLVSADTAQLKRDNGMAPA